MSMLELDPRMSELMAEIGEELAEDFLNELEAGQVGRTALFMTVDSDLHHAQHAAFLGRLKPESIIDDKVRQGLIINGNNETEAVQVVKFAEETLIVRSAVLACILTGYSKQPSPESTVGWTYRIVKNNDLVG